MSAYQHDMIVFCDIISLLIAYHVPNWLITPRGCKTNTASNTACRSPGDDNECTLQYIFAAEMFSKDKF